MERIPRLTGFIAALLLVSVVVSSSFSGCGYDGVEEENGRTAILDQVNMYLNSAMCDQAISLLRPLYESKYVDNSVRLLYSSAYACKAQFSFPTVLAAFKEPGSDLYATLVKAMWSTGSDGNLANYKRAAQFLREMSSVSGSFSAADRPSDANVYMVMMQAGALSSVISYLGVATRTTGKKTVAISAATRTVEQQCAAQVAFATISNSLASLTGSSGAFDSISASIASICAGAMCNNLSPDVCATDAAQQAFGDAILLAIDTQWQF